MVKALAVRQMTDIRFQAAGLATLGWIKAAHQMMRSAPHGNEPMIAGRRTAIVLAKLRARGIE